MVGAGLGKLPDSSRGQATRGSRISGNLWTSDEIKGRIRWPIRRSVDPPQPEGQRYEKRGQPQDFQTPFWEPWATKRAHPGAPHCSEVFEPLLALFRWPGRALGRRRFQGSGCGTPVALAGSPGFGSLTDESLWRRFLLTPFPFRSPRPALPANGPPHPSSGTAPGGFGGRSRLFRVGGIPLHQMVHFGDGAADLFDPRGLFPGCLGDLADEIGQLSAPLLHIAERRAGCLSIDRCTATYSEHRSMYSYVL